MLMIDYIRVQAEKVEAHLGGLIPNGEVPQRRLYEAARYSLMSGGKRLRPVLTLATAQALGASEEASLTPACALEFVHTYSLIHDDLPCMDDDDYRRGKPTVHKVYPESHAVLAGDYLLTYAFEILSNAPLLTSEQKLQLVLTLAKNIGGEGLIGGQILDLEAEEHVAEIEALQDIHHKKTALLISTAVEFGGIVAGAPKSQITILRNFGIHIGLAFQIIDDVLDVTASEAKHGRAGGSDAANAKATYVTLLGIEEARRLAISLTAEAIELLQTLPYDTSPLEGIASFALERQQ